MLDGIVEDTFGSTPDFPSSLSSAESNSDISASKNNQLKRRASLPDTESLYFLVSKTNYDLNIFLLLFFCYLELSVHQSI